MANLTISLCVLFLSIFYMSKTVEPTRQSRARAFIVASCNRTLYPALCIKSLSGFATKARYSPQLLAQIALSVSLVKAEQTRKFILGTSTKLHGLKSEANNDLAGCLDQLNETVDWLRQSVRELQRLGKVARPNSDPMWHINNIETWVSTALTNVNTCLDGFSGQVIRGKLKATIKVKVLNMAQHTSNALALVDRFAAKFRATAEEPV